MSYQKHLDTISTINDEFRYCKSIESLFELDQWSGLPEKGGAYRQKLSAYIAGRKTEIFYTEDARKAAEYFADVSLDSIEDSIERGLIRTFQGRYYRAVRTPSDLLQEYNLMRVDVMNAWMLAREKKQYQIFQPWLEKVFLMKKKLALAIEPDKPVFDTLIGNVDEGLRTEEVSREFDVLKQGISGLLHRIQKSAVHFKGNLLSLEQDKDAMAEFARRLAHEAGYEAEKGGFNHKVVHGFSAFLGPDDARIATKSTGSLQLILTCLHEAGHAMYATGGSERVNNANMWGGIGGGFQEANARFYENIIGRSRAYWEYYYPQLQETFPQFKDMTLDDFYGELNVVQPTLCRIEADEVTYSFHAILRFELERDYFAGKLAIEDMAEAWNEKYKEYLGICPPDDTVGVLQDMHWAGDYIGYFQSYALGNIYDGQILEAVLRDNPKLYEQIAKGDFYPLKQWMTQNIWQYGGCYTSGEMVKRLTGNSLDARSFLRYLEDKYTALYHI